ncbi:MAG TPA: Asp-tRNA(Asn)/Glu-tRNA(Gln) amidotransferase subunit GatA [Patescibacteria group bacterium]|nr:Asp-tRNA(Asn)/Glu-tRNA(Gln) amidotransferase subunit GatA [Patescibacteria group bacterium]
MTKLTDLTIAGALDGLRKKEFTAVEIVDAHIKGAEAARHLNCFITETFDSAREQAKAADERYAKGVALPLDGIPIAMKDLFCTEGVQTTAASRILEGFKPPYESTVSGNLKKDGTISLGKANLDEFAMGSSNTTSGYGNVINPWKRKGDNKDLVPGGSSGGSAAAVSARMAMGATGTDTGGSIRQPAAFCGIAGIKPTYGRCSRFGIVAFASSLDQAGPFARNTEDCALLLKSMAGWDPKDSTSVNTPVPDYTAQLNAGVKGLKIGVPKEYRVEGTNPEIIAMWDKGVQMLKDAGAEIVNVSLPHTAYALQTYYVIAPAECSSNLARYDGVRFGKRVEGDNLIDTYENTRAAGFGKEVRRRILIGTYVLSAGYYDAYYNKARKVRKLIWQDFVEAYKKCDVLLTPTAPTPAFAIGENTQDPVTMYLNDIFTIPASMAGMPGMALPIGLSNDGLPLGLQLIGKPFDEETIFRVAQSLEKAAAFTAVPQNIVGKAA